MEWTVLSILVNNVGLLLTLWVFHDLFVLKNQSNRPWWSSCLLGVFLGLVAILILSVPFKFIPGVLLDARSILISLSGLYFGLIPTFIAMVFASAFRYLQGGIGALTGIAIIFSSGCLGLLWRYLHRKDVYRLRWSRLYVLGLAATITMMLWMFTLPGTAGWEVWQKTGATILLIYPLATVGIGLILQRQQTSDQDKRSLEKREETYRNYLQMAPYGVYILNRNGVFLHVNDRFCRMTGFLDKEICGKNYLAFLFETDYIKGFASFEELIEKGESVREILLKQKDGKALWVEATTLRIDPDTFIGFALDRDVHKTTEDAARKNEALFRSFFEDAPEAMMVLNLSGRVLKANAKAAALLGCDSPDEIAEKSVRHFLYEEEVRAFEQALETFPKNEPARFETRLKSQKEPPVWVQLSAAGIKDPDGVIRLLCSFYDIQGRKRAETELNQSNRLLKQITEEARQLALKEKNANEKKGQFLAQMSHEIRTSLNGILGMIQLLSHTQLTAEQSEYTKAIQYSGNALSSIINRVLDLSKIEAGKLELDREHFDLRSLLQQVHSVYSIKAEEKGLDFSAAVDARLPRRVIGDPGRVNQIYTNFLDNAVKYTEKGSVHTSVTLDQEREETVHIRIEVADTGVGIPEEKKEQTFTPFSGIHRLEETAPASIGLGLSITKELIRLMDGQVGFESEEKRGSRFWCVLPFEKSRQDEILEEPSVEPEKSSIEPGIKKGNVKILVVEDNLVNQLMMKKILEKMGMLVIVANNGATALEILEKNPCDIVLMDCQMPIMDGWEATRKIRESSRPGIDPKIPIIAMTAYAMSGDRERCLEVGMSDYLPKPVDYRSLSTKIEAWLTPVSSSHPNGEHPPQNNE